MAEDEKKPQIEGGLGQDYFISQAPIAPKRAEDPLIRLQVEKDKTPEDPLLRFEISLDSLRDTTRALRELPPQDQFDYEKYARDLSLAGDIDHFVQIVLNQAIHDQHDFKNLFAQLTREYFHDPNDAIKNIAARYMTLDKPIRRIRENRDKTTSTMLYFKSQCPGVTMVTSQIGNEYQSIALIGEEKLQADKKTYGF